MIVIATRSLREIIRNQKLIEQPDSQSRGEVDSSRKAERYLPSRPFPAYAFVPGKHPHPITDPSGHSYAKPKTVPSPLDPDSPSSSDDYLHAIDLFNHGFYWEAHEEWEGLWVAADRTGTVADFLKGLIKLAAAGVKVREGQPTGVRKHALRAKQLFQQVIDLPAENVVDRPHFAGFELGKLTELAERLALEPLADSDQPCERGAIPGIVLKLIDTEHRTENLKQ